MTRKRFYYSFVIVLIGIGVCRYWGWFPALLSFHQQEVVNVYNWYNMIDAQTIREFEQETGIKVQYDLFDNNDTLEAKMLAGRSGYDVVFPTASPYLPHQIQAGAYQPLDRTLLTNWDAIDKEISHAMETVDPDNVYAVPYYWGTLGYTYVEEDVLKIMPGAPVHSYRMLFDPQVVERFSKCGVTFLEEAVDLYPLALNYLGKDLNSANLSDLKEAHAHLQKIRPHIQRFSSTRFVNELASGQTCIAQTWSGEGHLAQIKADEAGKNIHVRYVIPEEGTTLWIDVMAIPRDAPHVKNAHAFINFLLRPEISARLSYYTHLGVANGKMGPYLDPRLAADKNIYPPPDLKKKLVLNHPQSQDYDRKRNRLWAQLRFGKRL